MSDVSNYQPVLGNFDGSGNLLQLWGPNGKVAFDPSGVLQSNTLATVGDSLTAQWYFTDNSTVYQYSSRMLSWALALSKQRLQVTSNQATAGSRVTATGGVLPSFETQADTAIASGAKNLFAMGGINDIIAAVPIGDVKAAWLRILDKALRAGMRVTLATIPPVGPAFYSVSVMRDILALNDWIRQLACTTYARGGLIVADVYAAVVDPTSATGAYKSGYSYDDLHMRNTGAYYAGKEIARVWTANYPEAPSSVASNIDNYGFSSALSNLVDNGLFVNGAGTATGFTASGTTVTPSLGARSDGFGNNQRLAITAASTADFGRLTGSSFSSRLAVGDVLVGECEVTCSSITALRTIRLNVSVNGSVSNKTAAAFELDATNDAALAETFTATLRTPPLTTSAAQGAFTSATPQITAFFSGAGGATLDIGRLSVRKITSP